MRDLLQTAVGSQQAGKQFTLSIKFGFAIILIVINNIGTLIPFLVRKFSNNAELAFQCLQAFCGGLYVTIGLNHIFMDALERSEDLPPLALKFKLVPFLTLACYFLIMYVDKIMFGITHNHEFNHDTKNRKHDHTCPKLLETSTQQEDNLQSNMLQHYSFRLFSDDLKNEFQSNIAVRAVLPLIASIYFHSILENFAVGSQTDYVTGTISFAAVAVHAVAHTMVVTSRLLSTYTPWKIVLLFTIPYCFVAPWFIPIGQAVAEVSPIAECILNSFAAGTFIYIGSSEVLPEIFDLHGRKMKWRERYTKFGLTLLGFSAIILFGLIEGKSGE